jgi:hypothetical protein
VRVLQKEFNGQTYTVSNHAEARFTMRINPERGVSYEVLREADPYTLSSGYERGFVNFEEGVVFLVAGDQITTTIPLEGLEFSDDDPECPECGARIQETCRKPRKCRFCSTRVQTEVEYPSE